MFELIFATNNMHKIKEVQNIINNKFKSDSYRIKSLNEAGFTGVLSEEQNTLEGNALEKANFIYEKLKCNCFADDTGLEVELLNGEPGVYSARYAGNECDSEANINKLLHELKNKSNRNARFRTVIALKYNNQQYFFEGIIKGKIIEQKKGKGGFGYDSIFLPDGSNKTFAEMSANQKDKISHRAIAVEKLAEFLKNKTDKA